jgi:hypothetical protein
MRNCILPYFWFVTLFFSTELAHASHQLVTDVTDSNFDNVTASGAWMIEIYAQWQADLSTFA